MEWTTLVSAEELAGVIGRRDLALIDARFGMGDPAQGGRSVLIADTTAATLPATRPTTQP